MPVTPPFIQAWKTLLTRWNDTAFASSVAPYLPQHIVQAQWFGSASATESQIAQAERRLKTSFSPSYRAFLAVSNGWRFPGLVPQRVQLPIWINGAVDRIFAVEAIQWFRKNHKREIALWAIGSGIDDSDEADEDYFALDPSLRDPTMAPIAHLRASLAIGTINDSALLLNPKRINPDGEWEAWDLSPIGAFRYGSFFTLMQKLSRDFSTNIDNCD